MGRGGESARRVFEIRQYKFSTPAKIWRLYHCGRGPGVSTAVDNDRLRYGGHPTDRRREAIISCDNFSIFLIIRGAQLRNFIHVVYNNVCYQL